MSEQISRLAEAYQAAVKEWTESVESGEGWGDERRDRADRLVCNAKRALLEALCREAGCEPRMGVL